MLISFNIKLLMSRKAKSVVRNLPGFTSYCECLKSCSNVEVDHVIPRKFLRDNLEPTHYKKAEWDMHNLYRCCFKINNPKSHKIIGQNWQAGNGHDSYLARAALYMDWKYGLEVSEDLLLQWKVMALSVDPLRDEKERNKIITEIQGHSNPFIEEYPKKIILYN